MEISMLFGHLALVVADTDANQLPGDVVPLGQRVQCLACDELLNDLPLERGAVRSMFRHDFHPLEAQQGGSISIAHSVHPQGRTPKGGSGFTAI
jgi:hypothetical protein